MSRTDEMAQAQMSREVEEQEQIAEEQSRIDAQSDAHACPHCGGSRRPSRSFWQRWDAELARVQQDSLAFVRKAVA